MAISLKHRIGSAVLAGATAMSMCTPAMAFAANGVQDGTQSYGDAVGAPSEYAWSNGEGVIDLSYSTEGGNWQEPGADSSVTTDNILHNNGTYVLTIPKLISYTGMAIGNVSTSDDYTVNLRGALEAGKVVNVSAEASGSLINANQAATDSSNITFTTTRGKESWNAAEAYGTLNADGSLSGTNATDNIAMSGIVKTAGEWTGHVQYLCEAVALSPYGTVVNGWDVGAVENTVFATLYDSGALVFSGQGAMKDFTYLNSRPWYDSLESVTSVVIEDGVTSIGKNAFWNCPNLTNITIPDSVTSIGDGVFGYCTNLASVTIPDTVTSIGSQAFAYNPNLTSITIPDSVTSIGDAAFRSCSSLTSITVPDGVTSISRLAFDSCSSLTSVTIPDSVTSIGQMAFGHCTNLTRITIPGSVTSIGDSVFAGCSKLTSVNISSGVTSIGSYAFDSCTNLTSITIPDSVTSIGNGAFRLCSNLMTINCGFAEGAVSGAPWAAQNATINYNYAG